MKRKIGYNLEIDVNPVKCEDKKCPIHGNVSIRGKLFRGVVVSRAMKNSVKVMWERLIRIKKYNRYLKKRSVVIAHNPECLDANEGDEVLIGETRPLSKAKHFSVIKIIKRKED